MTQDAWKVNFVRYRASQNIWFVLCLREDNFALDFPRLCPLPSNFYLLWRVPQPFWLLTVSKWPASIVRTLSVPIILNLNRDLLWGRAIFSQCAGLPEGSFNTHSSVVETFLGLIPWWLCPLPVFFLWSFFPGSYDLINGLSVWSSFFSISNFWGYFLFYFYRDFLTCAFHSLSWEFFFFFFLSDILFSISKNCFCLFVLWMFLYMCPAFMGCNILISLMTLLVLMLTCTSLC